MLKRLVAFSVYALSIGVTSQVLAQESPAAAPSGNGSSGNGSSGSGSSGSGSSGSAPSAEDVQAAGVAFDAGRQAFREQRYEEAAEHFERADTLAPNAKVLLNAVSARMNAGQTDRAATLAILALRSYPNDENLTKEMNDLLEHAAQNLHRLEVSCEPACQLMIGTRLVHGPRATDHTLFLSAGEHEIKASFPGNRTLTQSHSGELGATGQINFTTAEPAKAAPVIAPVPAVKDEKPAPVEPVSVRDTGTTRASGGLSPTVFWVGVGATAVVGGVSVWSGIDTKNNPGKDKVHAECAGKTTSCPAYKTGKNKELRTNLLWAGTGALGVATAIVGVFATNWGTSEKAASDEENASSHRVAVAPWFDQTTTGLWATGRF